MASFKVLLYEDMREEGKAILREKADLLFENSSDEAYLVGRVKDVDGIIVRANGKVSRKIMESAQRLICRGRTSRENPGDSRFWPNR